MQKECLNCNKNIVSKLSNIIDISKEDQLYLKDYINNYLKNIDLSLKNPYVMGELYTYILEYLKIEDPYKDIKTSYNTYVSEMKNNIYTYINNSIDPLYTSMILAIKGNLIDFGANHTFSKDLLKKLIYEDIELTINDSLSLFNKLKDTKQLLYLCDNCGEIILDLIFLRYIHHYYPDIKLYLNVRSSPILNDICINDIPLLSIAPYIHIIHNGYVAPGVLYEYSSVKFKDIFDSSDIIISKGQGNFEGLSDIKKEHLYFLFMSKCEIVSKLIDVENMSIVCKKQNI